MDNNEIKNLIKKAIEAREKAYAPYSNFKVGAALLTDKNGIYTGCNIENAAYSASNCAERTAFFKAVSEGESCFKAIAIVGGENKTGCCPPCGVCRQVMMEFCDYENFAVILARSAQDYTVVSLKDLMPYAFDKNLL